MYVFKNNFSNFSEELNYGMQLDRAARYIYGRRHAQCNYARWAWLQIMTQLSYLGRLSDQETEEIGTEYVVLEEEITKAEQDQAAALIAEAMDKAA